MTHTSDLHPAVYETGITQLVERLRYGLDNSVFEPWQGKKGFIFSKTSRQNL
jgi:hypothetical protein